MEGGDIGNKDTETQSGQAARTEGLRSQVSTSPQRPLIQGHLPTLWHHRKALMGMRWGQHPPQHPSAPHLGERLRNPPRGPCGSGQDPAGASLALSLPLAPRAQPPCLPELEITVGVQGLVFPYR